MDGKGTMSEARVESQPSLRSLRGSQLALCVVVSAAALFALSQYYRMISAPQSSLLTVLSATTAVLGAATVDLNWYPPSDSKINSLTSALESDGVYGFIFNSSKTANKEYGTYNWCNMPHARKREYVKASRDYELEYVEVVSKISFFLLETPSSHVTLRFNVTTSVLRTPVTPSPLSHTSGIATTRACTFSAGHLLKRANRLPKRTGPASLLMAPTSTRSFRLAGSARASSRKSPPTAWTTLGPTAMTCTRSITICSASSQAATRTGAKRCSSA